MNFTVRCLSVSLLLFGVCLSAFAADGGKGAVICVAEGGKSAFPVIVSKDASKTTKDNAAVLASYLAKMTGARFKIEEGDGSYGIVLGRQADFSALPKKFDADPSDPKRTEEYLLYTHPKGLLLVGASDLGAQNAMWDFLGRQGYRQYFPGPTWEIIPSVPKMSASYDEVQKPSYIMRAVWFSGGAYSESGERYKDWCRKNRQERGFYINAGHSYDGFINHNKKIFEEHPEYYALVDGKRKGPKLNIANPDLRRLFVDSKLAELRKYPNQLSVSVDPSDGGGWDESEEAQKIGSPSNQAVMLANEVAEAIGKEFQGRYVGMYGYNQHAEPPTIKVNPNIFVLVATAFRGTRLSMKEQMEGWKKQGAILGIRDYLSYAAANYDIPARCARLASAEKKAEALKNYHDWGARVYSGESGDNWGINGLLYYTVARVLWDVNDTAFIDGLFEEFLKNCFGPVAEDIRPYYEALSPAGNPVLEPGFFNTLYSAIENARAKKPGEAIEARLDDLTIYVHYLELYRKYSAASGAKRLEAARELFSFLYRSRNHAVNAGYALIRDIAGRDSSLNDAWSDEEKKANRAGTPLWEKVSAPTKKETSEEDKINDPSAAIVQDILTDTKPVMKDEPKPEKPRTPLVTKEEIRALSADGVKNNPKLDFKPVSYSHDLVPAASILEADKSAAPGYAGGQAVHSLLFYTWAEKPGTEWRIKVTCGNDPKGRPFNDIKPTIQLWSAEEAEDKPVDASSSVIKQGETGELIVKSPHAGLHWVILNGARWQKIELDPSRAWTLTSMSDAPAPSQGASGTGSLYFYVPKGTRIIGAHIPGRGTLIDPKGKVAKKFDNDGYVKIDVPEGMDGRLWKINDIRGGDFLLLTVPPYFAASPGGLLLPREVVEREQGGKP